MTSRQLANFAIVFCTLLLSTLVLFSRADAEDNNRIYICAVGSKEYYEDEKFGELITKQKKQNLEFCPLNPRKVVIPGDVCFCFYIEEVSGHDNGQSIRKSGFIIEIVSLGKDKRKNVAGDAAAVSSLLRRLRECCSQ